MLYTLYNSGINWGKQDKNMNEKETFGSFFQKARIGLRMPLRKFCQENGFDQIVSNGQ